MPNLFVVFVHGWSVDDLNTYGQTPIRLRNECAARGINLNVQQIWLGQYVSFHDEVRMHDLSRAFQAAVVRQLSPIINAGNRFICVTHSTGGPVVRDWWERNCGDEAKLCPMSHLIMLAPANFGSALAQLGKTKLSQLKFWALKGEEPGQGILDWLELGSDDSWDLNSNWIKRGSLPQGKNKFYPFAIIGQSIERKFYDNLNRYTGEMGSDGVVRSAAANLNATLITIKQVFTRNDDGTISQEKPDIDPQTAPATAFQIVPKRAHSGPDMGIISSVTANRIPNDPNQPTIDAIIDCFLVDNDGQYDNLRAQFERATQGVQTQELVETVNAGPFSLFTRHFIHDRFCMVIFRVRDSEGIPLTQYKLLFTGPGHDANFLPPGFFSDRQQNQLNNETVTYFVNFDILVGSANPIVAPNGTQLRPASPGIAQLGIQVIPQLQQGFVRYLTLDLTANNVFFQNTIKPNSTILIDIILERIVSDQVLQFIGPIDEMPSGNDSSFADIKPGDHVVS